MNASWTAPEMDEAVEISRPSVRDDVPGTDCAISHVFHLFTYHISRLIRLKGFEMPA